MKISIKREQSQAGLSFAEREKFRPQVKRKRLLILLALLMTVATGAWAQEPVTYSVEMKNGTQDAKSWTITSGQKSATGDAGLEGLNEKDAVTLKYEGRLKVKGVTATLTPTVVVNKLSEITDAIAALNMQPGGEYTLNIAFDPAKIETNPTGNDNKLYMSIPDDATLNLVFKNVLPNGTRLTIGDAQFAGWSEPEVAAYFTGKDEPESKNHLNLDFAGGTGSENVDDSGLYMELITPYSTVATGSSTGNVWFEEIIIYTGGESFFSKLGSCVKKAVVKVGKTVASVATTVGKTVAKAAMTVVKKVVNLVVTKIIKPAVEQLVEKIKQNIVKEPLIPTVITATPSNFTFFEGQTQKFDVKVTLGNDGIGDDITFSSSAPSVATVDGNGNVKAISGGKPGSPLYTIITATIGSGDKKATRQCKVGVEQTPRPSAISFPASTESVPKDRAIILEPNIVIGNDAVSDGNYRISFTTNSPGVVAVNEFGYVRGLTMGEAVVTAHYGPLSANCTVTVTESVDGMTHVLDNLTTGIVVENGDVLTGTLDGQTQPYKITIADGATVTLDGVTINGVYGDNYRWAGLNCLGNATIVLKDGTTNTVRGFYDDYPGIHVPAGSKLTIQGGTEGTGKLTASPCDGGTRYSYAAGIGGGDRIDCGDIDIQGGVITATGGNQAAGIGNGFQATCGNISITGGDITATGGDKAAGIGSGEDGDCGNITITGGTVTATGGYSAAGIGSGYDGNCGNITIASTVTKVTAKKGKDAPFSIGWCCGSCGTVTIGGTKYWENNEPVGDGDTYLAHATIVYPAAEAPAVIVNPVVGQIIGSDGKNYDANATLPTGVTAVAKICYVGSETGEASPYNHGLALALSDANGGNTCKWKTEKFDAGHTKQYSDTFTEESGLQYNDATHNSDTYPAFKAAITYSPAAPTGCSSWFLASGYQWQKMIGAAGLSNLGLTPGSFYWSSSECLDEYAWGFGCDQGIWCNSMKDLNNQVRACLAF